MTNEEFRAVYGADPSAFRPEVRVAMVRKAEAGANVSNDAGKLRELLIMRHGSVENAPAVDRSRLAYLEGPRAALPKPRPPISVEDTARNAVEELAALEAQAEAYERPQQGDSVNVMVWKAQQARTLRDKVAGIRRRNPVS